MENSKLKTQSSKLQLKTQNFLVSSYSFDFYLLTFELPPNG